MDLKKPLPQAELSFHPACAEFDVLEGEAFDELVGDIARRGLRYPIITYKGKIIDGRNRALACAKAGVTPLYLEFEGSEEDVVRFIISSNVHRRHLKPEQRREKLVKLLKLHPEKSDRVIAAEAGVDRETVSRARKRTGGMPPVGKRTGKDGKARRLPTKKPKKPNGAATPAVDAATEAKREVLAGEIRELKSKVDDSTSRLCEMLGTDSPAEALSLVGEALQEEEDETTPPDDFKAIAELQLVRIEELEKENRMLKETNIIYKTQIENLENENADLKAKLNAWQTATGAEQPMPDLDRWVER